MEDNGLLKKLDMTVRSYQLALLPLATRLKRIPTFYIFGCLGNLGGSFLKFVVTNYNSGSV